MGSRSLACALVRHRQAEPRGARRRPWTFDRAGPNCYVLRARTTGLLKGGVRLFDFLRPCVCRTGRNRRVGGWWFVFNPLVFRGRDFVEMLFTATCPWG
jgi:hypothetical protein